MFLLTFLVVNMAPTRRELDNDLFTVSGIVQKYNCTLKRLDFQQEDGFLSSLPLGHNGIEIKRGMTTSSTAIFVPFMTQELRMDGEAVYYGLNALSHNVIMANRKKLKNPNGLFLGVPGSGKSFAAKRELVNVFLATRDRIIVVDPMGEYSPIGSTTMIRSCGMVRNTFKSSRFAAKLLPEPVEPKYIPFADFSFLRSAMMTL